LDKINGILRDERAFGMPPYENIYPCVITQVGRISAFCVCAAESPDTQKALIGPTVKQIAGILVGAG
jgi:hypothetical protein